MKYEWRKKDKTTYLPKTTPTIIKLEPMQYIVIEGEGNPNSESFQQSTEALYSLSYGIKMAPKKNIEIPGYFDYAVFPLEGIWSFTDEGKSLYKENNNVSDLKDYFSYTLMIRQPNFVDEKLFNEIKKTVFSKKKNNKILDTALETIDEGEVCQMMHVGPYDNEPASFQKMEQYCISNNYRRVSKIHKEIYLSDPRRVSQDKLKTTLRFKVEPF